MSLPLTALKGLAIAVIVYTSVPLIRDAGRGKGGEPMKEVSVEP